MQRQINTHIFVLLFIFLISGSIGATESGSAFTMRFAFLKNEKGRYKEVTSPRPIKMTNGDKFKIYMQTNKKTFLYLINKNPEGKAIVMYCSPLNTARPLRLPSVSNSYTIEPPQGTDIIYMVASANPQVKLENLLEALKNNGGNSDQIAGDIFDEIKRIKRETSNMGSLPMKPVPIGGTERGAKNITKKFTATEYYGRNIYVKTIRIRH